MIVTEIYNGQGLGNQLWCYIVTRVIAKEKGYDFGIMHPEKFKCLDFMDLDFGKQVVGGQGPEGGPAQILPDNIENYYSEKKEIHVKSGADIRDYDEHLMNISDNTKIDGIMQDEKYIIKYRDEIKEWLKVKKQYECTEYSKDNICVINFRGGEYVGHKDLILPQEYWDWSIKKMQEINPNFKFIVITDDVTTAKKFFPNIDILHFNIGKDYSIINNAYYLILSNSSFAWFPSWTNEKLKHCIAPKYWSRYNVSDGYWSCMYNITSGWHYMDRKGELSSYDECIEQKELYLQGIYRDNSSAIYEKKRFFLFKRNIIRKINKLKNR